MDDEKHDGKHDEIWLEVSNVRIKGNTFEVQLRADREPERPRWWTTPPGDPMGVNFKTLIDALDKKRPVLAQLGVEDKQLTVKSLSVQYAEVAR